MKYSLLPIMIFVTILLFGCDGSDSSSLLDRQAELEKNMGIWENQGILTYQYTYSRTCFCPPEDDIVIVVSEGEITEAYYTNSGEQVTTDRLGYLFTIDGLFKEVGDAIVEEVALLNVTYNESFGYPERIYIDVDEMMVDEEITHVVVDFQ